MWIFWVFPYLCGSPWLDKCDVSTILIFILILRVADKVVTLVGGPKMNNHVEFFEQPIVEIWAGLLATWFGNRNWNVISATASYILDLFKLFSTAWNRKKFSLCCDHLNMDFSLALSSKLINFESCMKWVRRTRVKNWSPRKAFELMLLGLPDGNRWNRKISTSPIFMKLK